MEFGQEPERRIWKETAKCKGKETAGTKVLQPTRALSILSTERSSMWLEWNGLKKRLVRWDWTQTVLSVKEFWFYSRCTQLPPSVFIITNLSSLKSANQMSSNILTEILMVKESEHSNSSTMGSKIQVSCVTFWFLQTIQEWGKLMTPFIASRGPLREKSLCYQEVNVFHAWIGWAGMRARTH